MSFQPDHPAFTAAALGEAPPQELAAFEKELSENKEWLSEADLMRETAARLTAALRQEPAGVFLTREQRRTVFSAGTQPQAASAPAVFFRTAAGPRRPGRRFSGFGPLLATAGVAAAVVLGIFAFSEPRRAQNPQSAGGQISRPAPAQVPEGIPAIALDSSATARKSGAPAPPPGLPAIPGKDPVLNPGSPLAVPPGAPTSDAIATSTPDIQILPAAPGRIRNAEPAAEPVPGTRRSGGTTGTLASPGNPGAR